MSRTVITRIVSDLSGRDIQEGRAVTIRASREADPAHVVVIDANEDEVADLLEKGTEQPRPGRRAA